MFSEHTYEIKGEGRRFAALLFALSIIQIAGYYFSAALVNGAGPLAVAQPDTLLYCQAARRICEGHAFSFSSGTAVSTGTTSVLYPFVLAIPYALGFVGDKLFSAGFALNALFYIVFLFGWAKAFRSWLAPRDALFATILLVLFPQTAYCALAQSDTGLWMAISALAAAGLASGNAWLYGSMLLLGPWVRPEGAVLNIALMGLAILRRNRRDIALSLLGIASFVGVFLFNGYLTGLGGFSSVANKGYFKTLPFADAICLTSFECITIIRDAVLGEKCDTIRCFYFVPVLGSLAFLAGLLLRAWKWPRDWSIAVVSVAAVGGILTVAQSGWQGTNGDRYFAWLMPMVLFFESCGWLWMYDRLKGRAARKVVLAIPLVFYVAAGVSSMANFYRSSYNTDVFVRFGRAIDSNIMDSASVGGLGGSGLSYVMGDRRMANLSGIYSPEFAAKTGAGMMEILKNEPNTRFDYLAVAPGDPFSDAFLQTVSSTELVGPDGYELRKMNWRPFDLAAKVPECDGRRLVDRVDVGYEKDEQKAAYEQFSTYGVRPCDPVMQLHSRNGESMLDFGRLVQGHDEMTITNLLPGKDLYVVMRTSAKVEAKRENQLQSLKVGYAFSDELDLHLSIDGSAVACCHAHVATNGFSDVVLVAPARAITKNEHRLGIHGDHLTFGYWIYQ